MAQRLIVMGVAGSGKSSVARALAERLGLAPEQVLICSTGVIGVPIPIDTLVAALDPLVGALGAEEIGRAHV